MPPVMNTYGANKKKRLGIPKFIYRMDPESEDIFNSLRIDGIKEAKALSNEEKRKKKKRIKSARTMSSSTQNYTSSADVAFDKLLNESILCDTSSQQNTHERTTNRSLDNDSSSSGCSVKQFTNSFSNKSKFHLSRKTGRSVLELTESKSKSSSSSENDDGFNTPNNKTKTVHAEEQEEHLRKCDKPDTNVGENAEHPSAKPAKKKVYKYCSPISPILPFGSTSTPCGTKEVFPFILSPVPMSDSIPCGSSFGVEDGDVSSDLFSDQKQVHMNSQVNFDSQSVDLFCLSHQTCDPESKFRLQTESHSFVEVIDVSSQCSLDLSHQTCGAINDEKSQDICLKASSEPAADCTNSDCNLLNKSEREELGCQNSTRDFNMSCQNFNEVTQRASNNSAQSMCNSLDLNSVADSMRNINLSSFDAKESDGCKQYCIDEQSASISVSCDACFEVESPYEEPKKCSVILSRCDSEELSKPNEDVNISSSGSPDYTCSSDHVQHMKECRVVLQRCDNSKKTEPNIWTRSVRNCKVLLSRCDDPESHSETCEDVPYNVALPDGRATSFNIPLSSLGVREESDSIPRDSLDGENCWRMSQSIRRQSNIPEAVKLKPGKQWRRSLSIISKMRRSSGEFPAEDKKSKGKRWESTVHSIIEMQSQREMICEESETSSTSHHHESFNLCPLNSDSLNSSSPQTLRAHCADGASEIYRRCGQDGPLPFLNCYPEVMKSCCHKIGEGVYGEVFFYSGLGNHKSSVIKIIPIEGELEVNGEPQKTFNEILSEVCVAQELSNLRNNSDNVTFSFNEVQSIRCVQGCYPQWLLDLWHDFDEKKGSENDSPVMFSSDQLYIVLELSNGGNDLESFVFTSAVQGLAAFKQIALTLAVGEKALQFEHRDLHWGNVLISSTKEKDINFILEGKTLSTPSKGIEVSIIDFTLSRISDPHSDQPIFYDLAKDETIFTAQGDYQFDIYRMMKDICGNQWDLYTPETNIAWLHYLLDKLCTMARYRSRSSKVHQRAIDILSEMRDTILMFSDAASFVKCSFFSE